MSRHGTISRHGIFGRYLASGIVFTGCRGRLSVQKFERVNGNFECLKLLEKYYKEAERGNMNFCGVISCEGNRFSGDYTGDVNAFHVAFFAVDWLQNKMRSMTNIEPFDLEDNDDNAPADKFIYDLNNEPLCHDFVPWLVTAEMMRRRDRLPGPLKVAFIRGKVEQRRPTQSFYENVMLPALDLFGAVLDPVSFEGRRLRVYATSEIVGACNAGEIVPRVQVPQRYLDSADAYVKELGQPPVTITLRETTGLPHRNSNLQAWCKFGRWLQDRGERVIFLRDTAKADEPLFDLDDSIPREFEIFPAGSRKVFSRVALYERAKCNLFVSNGPHIWALFGSRPWLCFVTIDTDEASHCNRPNWWQRYQGIMPSEQFPWSGPQQRMIYADDDFENLCAAWEETMEKQAIAA